MSETWDRVRTALGDVTNQIGKKRGFSSIDGFNKDEACPLAKKANFCKEFVLKPHSKTSVAESLIDDYLTPVSLSGNDGIVGVEESERSDTVVDGSKEKAENSLGVEGGDEYCLDDLGLGKDEFLDGSRFPESQESRCGFEKCVGQKGGDGVSSMCMDMIKECPCSFCIKGIV